MGESVENHVLGRRADEFAQCVVGGGGISGYRSEKSLTLFGERTRA